LRFARPQDDSGVELTLHQRMWTWQEILHHLGGAGFSVEECYGDVDLSPFSEKSKRIFVVAQKA
jgi:hypothetical protein